MKFPHILKNDPIFDRISGSVRTFEEKDEDEIRSSRFELSFMNKGAGFSFPCDSEGNILETADRSQCSRDNEAKAKSQDWEKIEIVPWTYTARLCGCGSGLEREEELDARGIFLTYACPKCRKEKLGGYRPEVLENSNYEADEQIEAD